MLSVRPGRQACWGCLLGRRRRCLLLLLGFCVNNRVFECVCLCLLPFKWTQMTRVLWLQCHYATDEWVGRSSSRGWPRTAWKAKNELNPNGKIINWIDTPLLLSPPPPPPESPEWPWKWLYALARRGCACCWARVGQSSWSRLWNNVHAFTNNVHAWSRCWSSTNQSGQKPLSGPREQSLPVCWCLCTPSVLIAPDPSVTFKHSLSPWADVMRAHKHTHKVHSAITRPCATILNHILEAMIGISIWQALVTKSEMDLLALCN